MPQRRRRFPGLLALGELVGRYQQLEFALGHIQRDAITGLDQGKRTADLLKLKKFDDAEFEVYQPDDESAHETYSVPAGETRTETFSVASADGSASQTITVVITGVNDTAVIDAGSNGASSSGTCPLTPSRQPSLTERP